MNIYYMEMNEYNSALYRADVLRIETNSKMCYKDSEELKKEEDFINVETSYKRLRQIMLGKKFSTLF
jgi:hypothetical protein